MNPSFPEPLLAFIPEEVSRIPVCGGDGNHVALGLRVFRRVPLRRREDDLIDDGGIRHRWRRSVELPFAADGGPRHASFEGLAVLGGWARPRPLRVGRLSLVSGTGRP